ncbi:hypothetical protein LTR91_004192 [Friedmanniomyces endolithicus]|uniref:SAM-dependent MTase RsmB/NOP-type domain-containing protein n=1 Tax=Friedmanniomyces endolithicus TaxID=329885 RepID=A0AAN6KUX1_9PEZI|nr:hypothetical protein LTR57_005299 [Friedmanniomyces endolithicus]KAK1004697.1 hypothetical protein LTR91_004192 [Friedmanniomyces endolithicus]KAK1045855.1 hypothetical protein LTS16_006281 [Friedmanniomyces endolithicus]
MSLYHEAASILDETRAKKCSIKSLVYTVKKGKEWKSDPKALFALSTEAAKWSEVLAEVVGRSGVLGVERMLSPTLALVLTYDLFLSKRGIALPASHGLHAAVSKHKARLSAELTKARLRRGCATLEELRVKINGGSVLSDGKEGSRKVPRHPRWVRINTLKTTLDEQLAGKFAEWQSVPTLREVLQAASSREQVYRVDEHIPNLIAIPSGADITTSVAYRTGQLILQDIASCFPAYLLDPQAGEGDVVDACAAPGNKTTHLAAILAESREHPRTGNAKPGKIIACEKDAARSETLEKMVKLAGAAEVVTVKAKQDFTKLPPTARVAANVAALLLDPSCSGSGMVGRDEESSITVHLPSTTPDVSTGRGKKRKRPTPAAALKTLAAPPPMERTTEEELPPDSADETAEKLTARLANLAAFQLRLLEHAMAFPAARRIVYSTCSIHAEENEHVVVAALRSQVAREQEWRVLRREEQVVGMRGWHLRGQRDGVAAAVGFEVDGEKKGVEVDVKEVAEACLRCDKHGEDGTMGFFVVGFVRDVGETLASNGNGGVALASGDGESHGGTNGDDEAWEGFTD